VAFFISKEKMQTLVIGLLFLILGLGAGTAIGVTVQESEPKTKTVTKEPKIAPYTHFDACKDHGGFLVYKDKAWDAVFVRSSGDSIVCQDGSLVTTPPVIYRTDEMHWVDGR
jgi:hypothetical protein